MRIRSRRPASVDPVPFQVVRAAIEDRVGFAELTILKPGRYRVAFPTAEQLATLRRDRPRGLAMEMTDGRMAWVEPV